MQVNPNAILDDDSIPKGRFRVRIRKWQREVSRNNGLMVAFRYVVVEPTEYANLTMGERMVVGTAGEGDPDGWGFTDGDSFDPTSFGAKNLKRIFKATHQSWNAGELGEALDGLVEQELVIYNEPEEYQDQIRPNVKGHYAIGEQPLSVEGNGASAPTIANTTSSLTSRKRRPSPAPAGMAS